ncbi:Eco47II restriction endonuclease [Daejeonella rubra]|uniref:Eco47II restriction endonuclease n=1 Tax=Daejeonella rubra TaxID=990371 RepID=A0A1G9Z220_9SPHI|nr:Eco47II family restriction endonuclease [Daejeonella rubra]SDN14791.1 Eco47II restriction endonuclease [Daejeonella rubra]
MKNIYLNYISDEHLFKCISNLHRSYINAKNNIDKRKFYKNKVDTIKLTFDTKFNDISEGDMIEAEVLRQIDKSINNFLGTFHEEILGGINGFERGNLSGFDIRAEDNTLFADIKNKHNTMNSSSAESLFQKLAQYANTYKKANCYWVQILANKSFNTHWNGIINGKEYSHSRVFKISGDQFYKLVTGQDDAFFQLYKILPSAIDHYLRTLQPSEEIALNSALSEIGEEVVKSNRTIIDQVTFDNYPYYLGFDGL